MLLAIFFLLFNIFAETKVIVKGNKTIDTDKIKLLIEPILNEQDAIKTLYYTRSFEKVKIYKEAQDYIVEVTEKPEIETVIFDVDNKKHTNQDLWHFTWETLSKVVDFKNGLHLDQQLILEQQARIKAYYLQEGFPNVRIKCLTEQNKNGKYTITYKIHLGDKETISSNPVFINNDNLGRRSLSKNMFPRIKNYILFQDSSPEPYMLEYSEKQLINYAKENGFLDAKIKSCFAQRGKDKCLQIYATLDERKKYKIGGIKLEFANKLEDEKITKKIAEKIKKCDDIESSQYIAASIKDLYLETGQLVSVKKTEELQDQKLYLKFNVEENEKKAIISQIIIRGNYKTQNNVILNAAKISKGSYIDENLINKIKSRVAMLNIFKQVNVFLQKDRLNSDSNTFILLIEVEEMATARIHLMANFGLNFSDFDESAISVVFSLDSPNFLGTGNFFSTDFNIGNRQKFFKVNYIVPKFNYSNIDFSGSFFIESDNCLSSKIIKKRKNIKRFIDNEKAKFINLKKEGQLNTIGYETEEGGFNFGLVFDCFKWGVLDTDLTVMGQETKMTSGSEASKELSNEEIEMLPRFFKPGETFPDKLRIYSKFRAAHKLKKYFTNDKRITLLNTFSISTDLKSTMLKWEPSLKFLWVINTQTNLKVELSGGIASPTNKHYWTENFFNVPVKGISRIGPTDLNTYTPLGGTKKFNFFTELTLPFIFPNEFGFSSYIGFYCGSIWDPKLGNDKIMKKNADLRDWKDDTPDIISSDFKLRASVAAGIKWRIFNFPLVWELGIYHPICFNEETDKTINIYSGLNFAY